MDPDLAAWVKILVLVTIITLASSTVRGQETQQILLLEVIVNGQSTNKIGEFIDRQGVLYITPQELREIGLRLPEGADGSPLPLNRLPGVHYEIDRAGQILVITATVDSLTANLLNALSSPSGEGGLVARSGTGFTLNHNVVGSSVNGQAAMSGLFDARLFTPYGVGSSGLLSNVGGGADQAIRLDSLYTYSDPGDMRRYRVGDVISSGLTWTRPVRLGGVQFSRDFAMRPDLVTFPVPGLSGQVAVPSTVDVMVNGVRQFSQQVPAGPFQVQQLPLVTGAGTVSMMVTDALGQQTTQVLPYYTSTQLLADGLSDYSLEVGAVRLNYGLRSSDYSSMAAVGSIRHGLNPWLTLDGHTEDLPGMYMGGGGLALNIEDWAVLSGSVAGSTFQGRSGQLFAGSIERSSPFFGFSASMQIASRDFMDIAAAEGQPVPRRTLRTSASFSFEDLGSLSMSFTKTVQDASTRPLSIHSSYYTDATLATGQSSTSDGGSVSSYLIPEQRVQLLTVTGSRRIFGNTSLYITGYRDFAQSHSAGVMLGMSIPLGGRSSANISSSSAYQQHYTTVQAVQSVVEVGDIGGQALASIGTPQRQMGEVDYKSAWGLLGIGTDRTSGQMAYRVTTQGAVSFADGDFFPSNTIYDSFAVVDTEHTAGIDVLQENRYVGTTGDSGRLLVPDLRAYDLNRISIDAHNVPADIDVGQTTREVRPPDRSGVVVRFPVRVSYAALVRLVDDEGEFIPVGSTATFSTTGVTVPVGYDGEIFLQDLGPRNQVSITMPGGKKCFAEFAFQQEKGVLPTIGPVPCRGGAVQ